MFLSETCDFGTAVKVSTCMEEHKSTYKFVTYSFFNCLPCFQTLNIWICAEEYKPRICKEFINNVSGIVRQELMKRRICHHTSANIFSREDTNRLERIKTFFDVVVKFQSATPTTPALDVVVIIHARVCY